jgi:HEPN domain-containing protein
MTGDLLGKSYFIKAQNRMKALKLYMDEGDYSDVVREAQKIVELLLKGVLRKIGIEPPKLHDVGPLIIEHKNKLASLKNADAETIAQISKWLRKEREFSFYDDIDLIPTKEYTSTDAAKAIEDTALVFNWAKPLF